MEKFIFILSIRSVYFYFYGAVTVCFLERQVANLEEKKIVIKT